MRTKDIFPIGLLALLVLLAGCAGGGSTTGPAAGGSTSSGTTISGVASKGIIKGGTVNIYSPPASGDIRGKILLKTVKTDASGGYSANVGNYSGIVLIEASGDYTDEATGSTYSISADAPLRAVAVVGSSETASVTVTPLTELATRKALSGFTLTPSSVNSANALVSNLFQWDILATRPVDPGVTAINAASQAQRDYTIALAGISELAVTAGSLTGVVDSFYQDLSTNNRLSPATVASFQTAVGTFLADSARNQTGLNQKSPALSAVGSYTGVLNLVSQGDATAPITSIQLTLTLPAGVTLKRDASGAVMVAVSGVANKASAPGVNYLPPSTLNLAIISSPGFGLGQFATITYVADPGTIPAASDFLVASSHITGFDGSNDFDITASIVPVLP
jgi:hypothetical protein